MHDAFFDTVLARTPGRAAAVVAAALDRGVNLRLVDADHVGITTDETTTREHLVAVWAAFGATDLDATAADRLAEQDRLPGGQLRQDEVLTHPVFHQHRSETAMLRYLRRLSDQDLALDRSMIPLGSCTMKLNATAEMEPITWPEFAAVHPFAPVDQARGYAELIGQLEAWLAEVTGYDAVSLQPNAGSQGELAGLLAIRAYHRANGAGDARPTVCLIPSSAHGTNAASAVMAGMRVVVVRTAERGQRRHGRPARQGRGAPRRPGRDHGHLPVDARRLRAGHLRAVRAGARGRRPGLRRRREPQRAGRAWPGRGTSAPTCRT